MNTGGCADRYSKCVQWAQQGYCDPIYYVGNVEDTVLDVVCPKSCGGIPCVGCPALPGYTFLAHQDHWGDDLGKLNGNLVETKAACDADCRCKSFNTATQSGLRLVNGKTFFEGRLELYKDGRFWSVCDDRFTDEAARVVCRQLGMAGGRAVCCGAYGSPASSPAPPIALDEVTCAGNETSLLGQALHPTAGPPLLLYVQLASATHPGKLVALHLQRVEGDSVWTVARLSADAPEITGGQTGLLFRDVTTRATWGFRLNAS
ncbi:hypothetical protein GPECTOR_37g173 [Gonium pectorale]|uniref:SRCR domain-containing protein n=1 Tax=Gonium pectorale TaxID=33097 RepID=A0A150GBD4_GONPE|nr:hypothetical protein GPECTOR_37g173 [Gonium pectorale]|eukprot:KXZ47167.1 hypothetical protein GPECTOR_37g173 [Gonium pectorale]